jgi:hypothetical protein
MRHILLALMGFIAGMIVAGASSHAAPGPVPGASTGAVAGGMVQKIDYWGRYYRQHGYAPSEVVVVPAPVPDGTAPVVEAAPILVPVRPLSCGQFRYWNGTQCVDARYNNPYVGPR